MRRWTGTLEVSIGLTVAVAACSPPNKSLAPHRPSNTISPILVSPDPDDDLNGLAHLPCAEGMACAATGPYLGETCCTYGDNLVETAFLPWPDAVVVAVDGLDMVTCGALGAATIGTGALEGASPIPFPDGTRCRHAILGPVTATGRMVWLSHSGDNTAPTTPRLAGFHLGTDGTLTTVQEIVGGDFLDIAWSGDRLIVAAGESGVHIYTAETNGILTLENTIGIDELAESVAFADDYLYVGTRDATLVSVDFSAPETPVLASILDLAGRPRLVRAAGEYISVALGAKGVQLLHRADPAVPTDLGTFSVAGTVQDLSMDGEHVAIATWHEALLIDPRSMTVLGSQRHTQPHGRTLGVQLHDGSLYIADRMGVSSATYRPGFVAADIHATPGSFVFGQHAKGTQLEVHNRGPMNLVLHGVALPDPAFTAAVSEIVVPAGDTLVFGLSHSGTASDGVLQLQSNDPDPLAIPLHVSPSPADGKITGFDGEPVVLYAMDLSRPLAARVILDLEDLDVTTWALHDGAAVGDDFALRVGSTVPVLEVRDLDELIAFPDDLDGPRLAILDATATVRAVRSHYDPEDLAHLVANLLDE